MTLSRLLAHYLTALTLLFTGSYAQDGTAGEVVDVTATLVGGPLKLLSLPLWRVDHVGIATPSLAKRYFKTDVLGVFGAAYLTQLTIGTGNGQQNVSVLLDTGSFELWVNPDCAASNVPDLCQDFGHYNPALSSTSVDLNTPYAISYGSGSTSGTYYTDDIHINSVQINNQQFGVAIESDVVWFGIMGLAHGMGNGFLNYPTIIDSLAEQNHTQSKLFSMDLGGQASPAGIATTGQMVFGGVDRNKYSGTLRKVPTDASDAHYTITLTGLSHRAPGSPLAQPFVDASLPLRVVVDSGTTLSLLPENLVRSIAAVFPGAASDGNGGYTVPCDYQQRNGSLEFVFGQVDISVAYRDFVWNSGGNCFLGVWYTPNVNVWILGDTFLRGAYVTFDQDNNALYMANYISCGSGPSLVPVPAGLDAAANIPGACQAAVPETTPVPSSTSLSGASTISAISPINPAPPTGTGLVGSQSTTSTTPTSTSVPRTSTPPSSPPPPSPPPSPSSSLSGAPTSPSSTAAISSPTSSPSAGGNTNSGLPTNSGTSTNGGLSTSSGLSASSELPTNSGIPPNIGISSSSEIPINSEISISITRGASTLPQGATTTHTQTGGLATTYTYTRTLTEQVVSTIDLDPQRTSCPDDMLCSGSDSDPASRLVTSYRTYITTFCDTTGAAEPTGTGQPQPQPQPIIISAVTTAGDATTIITTTTPTPAGNPPVAAPGNAGGGGGGGDDADADAGSSPEPQAKPQLQTVQIVTEQCSTNTYTVTACDDDDDDDDDDEGEGCTVGMMRTRVVTLQALQTTIVVISPTATATAAGAVVEDVKNENDNNNINKGGAVPVPVPVSVSVPLPPPMTTDLTQTTPVVAAAVVVESVGVGVDVDVDVDVLKTVWNTVVVSPAVGVVSAASASASASAAVVYSWPVLNGSTGGSVDVNGVASGVSASVVPTAGVAVVSGAAEGRRTLLGVGAVFGAVVIAIGIGLAWL